MRDINWRRFHHESAKYVFVIPALCFFCFCMVIPFCMGINIMFTNWDGLSKTYDYVGFANFARVFRDARLLEPLRNTVKFTLIGPISSNLFSLCMALLLFNYKGRCGKIGRLIIFMPACLSMVLSAFIWKFIFRFVLSELTGLNSPLGDPKWVIPGIVLIGIWNGGGINMLIYYAGLTNVPPELYEAAVIDGAGPWQKFTRVTVPMIMPSFTINFMTSVTGYMREFGTAMSATSGGPGRASETLAMYIYNNLYSYNKAGYGQALSFLFFIALLLVGNGLVWFFRKREVTY